MNIGIGTVTPQAAFVVTNGNVGIGTWTAAQHLDVVGTIKGTHFIGNGSGLTNISASAGGSSPQLQYNNGGSFGGITGTASNGTNIGIGTVSLLNRLNLAGNVGISTLANSPFLTTNIPAPTALAIDGNVGIGTWIPGVALDVVGEIRSSASGDSSFAGNVGIGSEVPGAALDVVGQVRASTFSGNGAAVTNLDMGNAAAGLLAVTRGGTGVGSSTGTTNVVLSGSPTIATPTITTSATVPLVIGGTGAGSALQLESTSGSGTSDSIQFLLGSQSEKMRITTAGNVGIGTTVPAQLLDVLGTAKMTGFQLNNSPAAGSILMSNTVGVGSWIAASAVASGSSTPGGSSPQLQYNNGGSFGGITSSASNGTNIGIGTVSLVNRVNMAGNVGIATLANSNFLSTSIASPTALIIDGTVGIGTHTPYNLFAVGTSSQFHVSNQGYVTATAVSAGGITGIDWDTTIYTPTGSAANPGDGAAELWAINQNDGGDGSLAFLSLQADNDASDSQAAYIGAVSNTSGNTPDIVIGQQTGAASYAERMRIDANGNVGIGTWFPSRVLDVIGTAKMTSFQMTTSPAAGSILMSNTIGVGSWIAASAVASGSSTPGGSSPQLQYNNGGSFGGITSSASNGTNIGIGTVSLLNRLNLAGNVGIATLANSSFMSTALRSDVALAIDGNVGIGTWVPSYALDLYSVSPAYGIMANFTSSSDGAIQITATNSGRPMLYLTALNSYAGLLALKQIEGSLFGWEFHMDGNINSIPPVVIDSNGNLGLGTVRPQAKIAVLSGNVGVGTWTASQAVDVIGTVKATYFLGDGSQLSGISASAGGSSPQLQYNNGGSFGGITSSASNGTNIGIGTVSLLNRLNLAGNVGIATLANSSFMTTALGSKVALAVEGNVGIGTQMPRFALEVNGTAKIVDTSDHTIGFVPSGATGPYMHIRRDSSNEIFFHADDTLTNTAYARFGNASTMPTMTWLFANGRSKVGIGTTTITGSIAMVASSGVGIATNMNSSYITTAAPTGGMIIEGNVGIGTWVPRQKLEVNGSILFSGGGDNYFGSNVGIGSTVPTQALDVAGTVKMSGFQLTASPAAGSILMSNATGVGTWIAASAVGDGTGSGSPGGSSPQLQYNSSGSLGGITATASNGTNIGIGTVSVVNRVNLAGTVGIATLANSSFVTTALNSNIAMAVDGNVGIGTRSPVASLNLQNFMTNTSGTLYGQKNELWVQPGSDSSASFYVRSSTAATNSTSNLTGGINAGEDGVWHSANNTLTLSIGNQAYSKLSGVGTITTAHGLLGQVYQSSSGAGVISSGRAVTAQVVSDGASGTMTNAYSVYADLSRSAGTVSNWYGLYVTEQGSASPNYFSVLTGTTKSSFGGNVGIGTITPGSKLAVLGGVGIGTGANSSYVSTAVSGGGMIVEGNIGVGTLIPSRKLEVMGNVGIGTTADPYTLKVNNTVVLQKEYDNGSKGGAFTVDWNLGNKQKVTLTGSTSHAATFTNPTAGVGNFLLKIAQGDASNTVSSWAGSPGGSVKWVGAAAPTLSTTINYVDIITCYFDGTDYYCAGSLNFQ